GYGMTEAGSVLSMSPSFAKQPLPTKLGSCGNVVRQKDEAAGELPVAFVVPSNGFELTEETVKEFVSKQVVFYKRLHKVYFVHAISKSPAGKILRKDLRAKLAAPTS
ncbi:hypothetical protein MIMGU_mgv1a017692mg, partial [Erythranthe guttata]